MVRGLLILLSNPLKQVYFQIFHCQYMFIFLISYAKGRVLIKSLGISLNGIA